MATRCPKCRSSKIKSAKFMGHKAGEAAKSGVHLGHAFHNPVIGLVAGAAWLVGKAIDAGNHEWCCESCNHQFSSSAGACVRCTGKTEKMYNLYCCKTLVCMSCNSDLGSPHQTTCEICTKPLIRK
jgi:hypothetical protein